MPRRNKERIVERPASALEPTRVIAQRHDVCIRTVERWIEAGLLPPPMKINGRKYWPAGTTAKLDDASP
jgi:predicted site-specific integrase-resolvase